MRELVLRLLRVPPEPHPPAGDRLRVFRAGKNFYKYKLVLWTFTQIGAIAGAVFGLLVLRQMEVQFTRGLTLFRLAEIVGWITLAFQIPFTFAILRLDYEMRWYIVTDRSLRIREGVASVVEKTMTFRNIQQISIRQGPIQRALGIADVEVRTAGGGASSSKEGKSHGAGDEMHAAAFRGVDNATEIRDVITERVRLYRDSGLGDPDDARGPAASSALAGEAALAAAAELLAEARALRHALER
ncbi:MAG TPA: PH domain-containing protein [Thermoanaerobaculia bacterium]|nr:PH domain-containing protein [Thermoanaerobaculia bacterium]